MSAPTVPPQEEMSPSEEPTAYRSRVLRHPAPARRSRVVGRDPGATGWTIALPLDRS